MLQVSRVSKRYQDPAGREFEALDSINLRIEPHEAVAFVGASGCGKTTLLRIIAGLESASEGRVALEGAPIVAPHPDIGVVFQEPRLMPWLNVRDNIRLALLKTPREEQSGVIEALLAEVGLSGFAEALPRQLSGGMAQRVAIARALARHPRVLVLDEPFSALDYFTRLKLQHHLSALWDNARFTMILVTHDIEEAVALADRIVVMSARPGRIGEEIAISLPRPRIRSESAFQAIKEQVTDILERALARSA